MNTTTSSSASLPEPPTPCGYCRRCAIHDDPGGCLTVEAWERDNPEAAGYWRGVEARRRYDESVAARLGVDPFDRAEAMGDWDADDGSFAPAGAML